MDGSFEYTERAVTDSRQGVVLQVGGWARCLQLVTVKSVFVTKRLHLTGAWTDPLVRPEQWKTFMKFGTWNAKACVGQSHLQ